jgi:polysaccharide biosynthesis transport protein
MGSIEPSHQNAKSSTALAPMNLTVPANLGASTQNMVEQAAPAAFDYAMLLRPLRGRFLLVAILALVCAPIGGIIGWHLSSPRYRCEGLIRIAYVLPSVMHETDQNGPIAMFDAYLRSEGVSMQSWRLINLALNDPAWVATGKGNSPQEVVQFASGLLVEHPNNTDTIRVTFTSENPTVAVAAVRSIINVFADDYTKQQAREQQQRLKALVDRQQELTHQLGDLDTRWQQISKEFGGVDLERVYEEDDQQILDLSRRLADVRLALAMSLGQPQQDAKPGGAQSATALPSQADNSAPILSIEEIAKEDPLMAQQLAEEQNCQKQLDDLNDEFGSLNPQVIAMQEKLKRAKQYVRVYAEQYRDLHAATATLATATAGNGGFISSPSDSLEPSRESLQRNETALSQAYDKLKADMPNLLMKRRELEDVQASTTNLHRELDEVTNRRDSLQVESAVGDRLEILNAGDVPVSPFVDHRLYFAVAGALGGAVVPAALIIGIGMLKRRYRFADETAADMSSGSLGLELLGVLPSLSEDALDTEQAADTAQCIHQFRARMQIAQRSSGSNVYLVTSASPGEGKTSVAMSLALSFAAAGSRTLLIDCDFVGLRLTHGLHAEQSAGVREAMTTGKLSFLPVTRNLSVLTAGRVGSHDACTIASSFIKRLIRACRKQFDVVFFDSGPILGSVEASVVASEVDSVVVVVSRGQKPAEANRAVRQLRALGARFFGVIFNRAKMSDFTRSYPVSSSLRSGIEAPEATKTDAEAAKLDFGPIVRAVAASLPGLVTEYQAAQTV